MSSSTALVISAHPHLAQSRVNRRLMRVAQQAAVVRDLYAHYPDYWVDVPAEQSLLTQASLVVWQHPIHWYSMPALMKLWVDEVLTLGWAYGPGGTALQGKDLWLVVTTGGPEDSYRPESYNRYHFDAFLPAYEQTAALCGMRFLPPMVLHGAHQASEAELAAHEQRFVQRLLSHPHWPELKDSALSAPCDVPSTARPESARTKRD